MSKDFINKCKEAIREIIKHFKIRVEKSRKELEYSSKELKKWELVDEVFDSNFVLDDTLGPIISDMGESIGHTKSHLDSSVSADFQTLPFVHSTTAGSTIISSATGISFESYDVNPKLVEKIIRTARNMHEENCSKIVAFLERVSPHLKESYLSAWQSLNIVDHNPALGAAAAMREVISQTLRIMTPANIKTMVKRVDFIADQYANSDIGRISIKDSAQLFRDCYEELNDIHKREILNKDEIESYLYQADDLFIKLAENVDLDKWKESR